MTNADKIKSMTDEELAEWLDKMCNRDRTDWDGGVGCCHCLVYGTHHYPGDCADCEWRFGILGWLKSEIKSMD